MNLKRRGFLGFLGGAAAAGPKAVANVVEKMPDGLGLPFPGHYFNTGGEPESVKADDSGWRAREIAEIRAFLAGKLTDEHKAEILRTRMEMHRTVVSQGIAQLRSVSAVHKVRIFNREMEAISVEMERASKRGYLSRLLKRVA